jgi:hemerythrin-like domain-containing protein
MKRHASLIPLSSHHQIALVQAKNLRSKTLTRTEGARVELAETFLACWDENGRSHFREEEEVVLPTLGRFGDAFTPEVQQMLRQHIDIRGRVDTLAEKIDANSAPSVEELRELGEILDAHVRLEEHEIFPYVERTVPEEELIAMQRKLEGR